MQNPTWRRHEEGRGRGEGFEEEERRRKGEGKGWCFRARGALPQWGSCSPLLMGQGQARFVSTSRLRADKDKKIKGQAQLDGKVFGNFFIKGPKPI